MIRGAISGLFIALLAAIPIAVLFALVDRFPFPGVGYRSGPMAAIHAPQAALFYGLKGGFLVIGLGGAIAGAIAGGFSRWLAGGTRAGRSSGFLLVWTAAMAITIGLVGLLAHLDQFIGPW